MFSIGADERAALQFDDLASALDAGLPITSVGGDAAAGERAIHSALARRGVRLSPTEDTVLLHAWRAGRIGEALRGRARERTQRAEFTRTAWTGLRYPLLLAGMLLVAAAATGGIAGYGYLLVLLAIYAVIGTAIAAIVRGVRRGQTWVMRVPVLRGMLADLGELPYLETLAALYGSGVPLKQAHAAACATVRIAAVADRLRIADGILQAGQPLREALAQSLALHAETRTLLTTGEHAGQLESALGRALARRREVVSRSITTTCQRVAQVAYGAAVIGVAVIVARFYSAYFSRILH